MEGECGTPLFAKQGEVVRTNTAGNELREESRLEGARILREKLVLAEGFPEAFWRASRCLSKHLHLTHEQVTK